MCECGCTDQPFEEAFQIVGSKSVIAYQVFHGCSDCSYGPSLSISFFDSAKACPIEGMKIQTVHPNEYGAGREDGPIKYRSGGFGFGLFDIEDLEAEAKAIREGDGSSIGPDDEEYASIEDWLHDHGQDLVSGAMTRYRERIEKERKARKAREGKTNGR